MAILTAYIAANADDGQEWDGNWYIDGDAPGSMYAGAFGGPLIWMANRFQINLANTVTINSATLNLYATGDQTGTPLLLTRGDDVDNSTTPSASYWPSGRTFTTANTTKNLTAAEWGSAGWVSLTVTGIVAEIIARAGWSANNYLSIITTANTGSGASDYVGFEDYSAAGSNIAYLEIDYTAGGGGGSTQPPRSMQQFRQRRAG